MAGLREEKLSLVEKLQPLMKEDEENLWYANTFTLKG